jgi:hypothetical protein
MATVKVKLKPTNGTPVSSRTEFELTGEGHTANMVPFSYAPGIVNTISMVEFGVIQVSYRSIAE